MARNLKSTTLAVLKILLKMKDLSVPDLYRRVKSDFTPKQFADLAFRLQRQGLVEKKDNSLRLTPLAEGEFRWREPERDGVWKMIIYDIPEKDKEVRNILRSKLKQLNFKKWQNSIWVSPYKLDPKIERELLGLAQRFFVRLIRVATVNKTDDLEALFDLEKN